MSDYAERLLASRSQVYTGREQPVDPERAEEGGCGVTGFACTVPVKGKFIYEPSIQMQNRGNGKGGGIAAVAWWPSNWASRTRCWGATTCYKSRCWTRSAMPSWSGSSSCPTSTSPWPRGKSTWTTIARFPACRCARRTCIAMWRGPSRRR